MASHGKDGGIFSYICLYQKSQPNVWVYKFILHGWYRVCRLGCQTSLRKNVCPQNPDTSGSSRMGLVSIPSRLVIGLDRGNPRLLSHANGSLGKDQNDFGCLGIFAQRMLFLLIDECLRRLQHTPPVPAKLVTGSI